MTERGPDRESSYGTRWKRTLAMTVACLGVVGTSVQMMYVGAIDTTLVVESSTAQLATNAVTGTNVGIGVVKVRRSDGNGGYTDVPILRVGLAGGKIDGLCLSQKQTIGPITYLVKVSAGNGIADDYEIAGSNAVLDATSVRGNGDGLNFDGMVQLGVAAHFLTTTGPTSNPDPNPLGATVGRGWFGIDADIAQLKQLRGNVYDVQIGGPFSIPGLKIEVLPGDSPGCADPSQPIPK